jgi:hypothetical protein
MRFYEHRQSATSPLKYNLELSPDELEMVKEQLMEIAQTIISNNGEPVKNNHEESEWEKINQDIVEWMTEPTKFPPRSDCG